MTDGAKSGDNGRVGDVLREFPSVGELQGVTVGEKFCPEGVFKALGVTALMPLSFKTEARPIFTEKVLHELRRERIRGVGGALKLKIQQSLEFNRTLNEVLASRCLSRIDIRLHPRRHLRRRHAESDARSTIIGM